MKTFLTLGIILLVAGGVYMLSSQNTSTDTAISETEVVGDISKETRTPYNSETMGISFAYASGSNGYTLIEPENMGNESEDFVDGVVLIRTSDYEDMQSAPDRGGPPAITVRAFNTGDTLLIEWLQENSYFTNYQPGQLQSIVVGDVEGVKYSWEGMFYGETVAILYRGRVYMFESTYTEMGDQILTDFTNMLETVSFATPSRLTITGTYVCLGQDAVINPPSDSCQRGLLTTDGQTYALDLMLMSQTPPPLSTGDEITVSGVFNPQERLSASVWTDLGVEGILSATSLSKE